MSLAEQTREDVVRYRTERAFIALEQAKQNLEYKCLEVTANRLYYAAYYAVSALLIANRITIHSHAGCIGLFGQHMVKSGRMNREDGRLLNHLFAMRLTGDYSDRFDLTEEEVLPFIEPTETFIKKATDMAFEDLRQPE